MSKADASETAVVAFSVPLHRRSTAGFCRIARGFDSEVRVAYLEDGEPVIEGLDGKMETTRIQDGKSIFGLEVIKGLVKPGDRLQVEATGPDAEEAVEELTGYLRQTVDRKLQGAINSVRAPLEGAIEGTVERWADLEDPETLRGIRNRLRNVHVQLRNLLGRLEAVRSPMPPGRTSEDKP